MSDSFHRNVNLEKELNALQARMDNKMNELQVSANDFIMFFFFIVVYLFMYYSSGNQHYIFHLIFQSEKGLK